MGTRSPLDLDSLRRVGQVTKQMGLLSVEVPLETFDGMVQRLEEYEAVVNALARPPYRIEIRGPD